MGLFDRMRNATSSVGSSSASRNSPAAPYFRERTFTMPCTRGEALDAIINTQDYEGVAQFGERVQEYLAKSQRGDVDPGRPPLQESIYIETLDENGFVMAAGNRVTTFWRMRLALEGDDPVRGSFGAISSDDSDRWFGNVMNMVFILERVVQSVGGQQGNWPSR